jgi:hemoglobin
MKTMFETIAKPLNARMNRTRSNPANRISLTPRFSGVEKRHDLHNRFNGFARMAMVVFAMAALNLTTGCRSKPKAQKTDFFTSGSKEADQRAGQRMAKAEQISGTGEGAGEKGAKKASKSSGDGSRSGTNTAAQAEGKMSLYDRLGGDEGLAKIVDDFTPRVLQDPRVNWPRNNVKRHTFSLKKEGETATWKATPENVAQLKKHLVQFLALATGGPAKYEGKEIKSSHAGMQIGNPEFDAAIGDVKASLDKLQIPNKEQKELLAILESTRPQIVTQR